MFGWNTFLGYSDREDLFVFFLVEGVNVILLILYFNVLATIEFMKYLRS